MKIRNVVILFSLAGFTLVIILFLNLNTLIKTAIEQTLSKSLAAKTNVTAVAFNPLNGYLRLNEFEINNPDGFSAPKFLQVQDFIIQIKPISLLGDRIEIEKIYLKDISINIEQQFTRNNIQEIFASATQHKQSGQANQEKKFNLHSATIDNISVNLDLVQFGISLGSTKAALPKVELQNLNSENYQALLMSEVLTKLISYTLKNIVEQNKLNIPRQILDTLKIFTPITQYLWIYPAIVRLN